MLNVFTPRPFADPKGRTNRWYTLHKTFKESGTHANPKIIFMGDCLFSTPYDLKCWDKFFSKLNCMTFAIRDDRIENLLWRIQEDELLYTQPKILVLNIGRNDLHLSTPWEIANGIMQCVDMVREKLPSTFIIVPSICHITYSNFYEYKKDKSINAALKRQIYGKEKVSLVRVTKKIRLDRNSDGSNGKVRVFKDYWGLYRQIITTLIENK